MALVCLVKVGLHFKDWLVLWVDSMNLLFMLCPDLVRINCGSESECECQVVNLHMRII